MSDATLEERVKLLENQVAQLLHTNRQSKPTKDWRRTVGMFTGDPVMREIQEEARRFRIADRERAKSDNP